MKQNSKQRAEKFYELREQGTTADEIASTYFLSVKRVEQIIASYERGLSGTRAKTNDRPAAPIVMLIPPHVTCETVNEIRAQNR